MLERKILKSVKDRRETLRGTHKTTIRRVTGSPLKGELGAHDVDVMDLNSIPFREVNIDHVRQIPVSSETINSRVFANQQSLDGSRRLTRKAAVRCSGERAPCPPHVENKVSRPRAFPGNRGEPPSCRTRWSILYSLAARRIGRRAYRQRSIEIE
jgi:hypothetical protein